MNPIKAVYCRAVQAVFRAALPVLPYREPEIVDSCEGLDRVMEQEGIKSVLDKKCWLDLPMRYQPYQGKLYETLLHLFLR